MLDTMSAWSLTIWPSDGIKKKCSFAGIILERLLKVGYRRENSDGKSRCSLQKSQKTSGSLQYASRLVVRCFSMVLMYLRRPSAFTEGAESLSLLTLSVYSLSPRKLPPEIVNSGTSLRSVRGR